MSKKAANSPSSLNVSIKLINNYLFFVYAIMPNVDPWINQNSNNEEHMAIKTINRFENHLLALRDECQKMIQHKSYPAHNAHHQKIIEIIDWFLDK